MTYWSDHANHPRRDIWDWIGVCNTLAQSIGLNRDPSSASNMDSGTKRLRTRLWWCLYSRDRLIAMGLRRPSQLNEGTSNVPMLKLEDFDFEPYHTSVTAMFHCRQLEDISHQKRLATMFVEKTKLCQCIGRVLFAQYAPSQCQFGTATRTTITLVPRQASESELGRCSQKLESWLNGLPKDAQFIPESKDNIKEGEDVLLLHSAMLRMLYHATISALHRPWALGVSADQSKTRQELTRTARAKMHDSALGITHIIQGLNQLDLTRFLPQSGVTVILPAAVAHLTNSNSDNPTIRETSIYHFQKCVQVLQGLKDIYPAADMEVANIEAAVKVQSDSANAFLRVMQYNMDNRLDSDSPKSQAQRNEGSQTPQPTGSQQHHEQQQQQQQHGKQSAASGHHPAATQSSSSNTQKDTQQPHNDFNDHFNLNSSPNPSNPITPSILLTLDDMINNSASPFPDFPSPHDRQQQDDQDQDFAIDWADELVRESELNPGSASGTERRDMFMFSPAEHGNWSSMGHTPGDITGDLDRDLGLVQ